jgi:hypothetical protein
VAVLDARPRHHHLYNSNGVEAEAGDGDVERERDGREHDARMEIVAGLRQLQLTHEVRRAMDRACCAPAYDDALSLCGHGGPAEGLWATVRPLPSRMALAFKPNPMRPNSNSSVL